MKCHFVLHPLLLSMTLIGCLNLDPASAPPTPIISKKDTTHVVVIPSDSAKQTGKAIPETLKVDLVTAFLSGLVFTGDSAYFQHWSESMGNIYPNFVHENVAPSFRLSAEGIGLLDSSTVKRLDYDSVLNPENKLFGRKVFIKTKFTNYSTTFKYKPTSCISDGNILSEFAITHPPLLVEIHHDTLLVPQPHDKVFFYLEKTGLDFCQIELQYYKDKGFSFSVPFNSGTLKIVEEDLEKQTPGL